ncbi:MAG: hypothetical protein WBD36_06410, partial [Bacteroidota bacterium]
PLSFISGIEVSENVAPGETQSTQRHLLNPATAGMLLMLAVFFSFREIYSPDIGFHIKAGEWILSNFSIPRQDIFTYTVSGNEYIDLYWIYQIAMAIVNRLGGPFGLVAFNAIVVVACFSLLFLRTHLRNQLVNITAWQVVALLSVCSVAVLFEIRPHSFSWLYLGLTLLVLEEWERGRERFLWTLPVIMIAWTNTHTVFMLGWIAMASYWIGSIVEHRTIPKSLTKYAVASILASFLNPYFIKGIAIPFYQLGFLQTGNVFKSAIAEYASPLTLEGYVVNGQFTLFQPLFAFHLFLLLVVLVFVLNIRRWKIHEILILILFTYVGLTGVKNLGYFVFAVAPMMAVQLQGSFKDKRRIARLQPPLNLAVICFSVFLVWTIVTNRYYIHYRSNDRFGVQYNNLTLPDKACTFVLEHRLGGKVLNHFNFGGFLILRLPQRVFIDGRNEVVGERFYSEYSQLWNDPDKNPILKKYNPDIVIFPHLFEDSWVEFFRSDSTWRLVYIDETAAVYCRNGYAREVSRVEPGSIASNFTHTPPEQYDSLLGISYPQSEPRGFFQSVYFPQREIGLSTFCYKNGWFESAVDIGIQGLMRTTVQAPEMYYNLGNFFFEKRDFVRASFCYERFLDTNNDPVAATRLKAIRLGLIASGMQ